MSTIALSAAIGIMVTSLCLWRRARACTSCVPHCPNGHRHEISGQQGMFIASAVILFGAVLDLVLR